MTGPTRSFGPADVSAWPLSIAVESGEGPAAERITAAPGCDAAVTAADRRARVRSRELRPPRDRLGVR
ncbi:hypothetical protein [Saccharothrix australiensis]|uniref:Uncharacterized protein n=1 Tax=Saccharothrix australiensis TaxID=2072 RepID=A0A495W7A1_9PSEU|nr:hypothetical protein [Saccharothrix australiensis]RKT55678.1 hypothetical protein C8E97_4362 [Saccharothrix australiensis]